MKFPSNSDKNTSTEVNNAKHAAFYIGLRKEMMREQKPKKK